MDSLTKTPFHKNGTFHLGGTYNRVPRVKFIEREFVEPNASDYFIYWLFKYRCIQCKHPATEINEITPRSRSKKAIFDWKNRVPLCKECHSKYHTDGVTELKMRDIRKYRDDFLKMIGRDEYV